MPIIVQTLSIGKGDMLCVSMHIVSVSYWTECHDLMEASLSIIRGQGILNKQKFTPKLSETAENPPRFCFSLNEFLYILKTSMDDTTSEKLQ